jgi:two-component system osmolarity sensor histidine kinase EnvZ
MGARGNELEIVVDDAGPGVPPEQRENIFRPFHRGPTAKGRRVGFGLGLALTHSAVRAQGGRIEVGDSPAGGARFRILLPLRRA